MTRPDYSRAITVSADPAACFVAIARQMDQWWTRHTSGNLAAPGARLRVDFPPAFGFWRFEATSVTKDARIEAICTDASHTPPGQPASIEREWVGTRVIWEIVAKDTGTEITLTHHGLTPQLGCFGICIDGWDRFFAGSLKAYLDTGTGTPFSAG